MMGSVGTQLRGEEVERFIANQLGEPIGDSGRPWEGDVVNLRESLESNSSQNNNEPININRLARRVENFENKTTFRQADYRNLNALRRELENSPQTRDVIQLLTRVNNLLRELR